MHYVRVMVLLCALGFAAAVWAAPTGYTDDFTTGARRQVATLSGL